MSNNPNTIDTSKLLTRKNFIQFIEADPDISGSDNMMLVISKTKIAKHFGISVKTLFKWMRKMKYGYLIKKIPKQLVQDQHKQEYPKIEDYPKVENKPITKRVITPKRKRLEEDKKNWDTKKED